MININSGNVQRVVKELATGKMSKHLLTPENWKTLSYVGKLPAYFIDKFSDELDWTFLVMYQEIPEALLDKYKDKLNWKKVCIHQKMSEDFMIEHEELMHWKEVWYCQEFSDEFYEKYRCHLKYYKDKK